MESVPSIEQFPLVSPEEDKEIRCNKTDIKAKQLLVRLDEEIRTKTDVLKQKHCKIFEDLKRITVKYGSNYRSRIINSEVEKSVCKAILNNRNPAVYIKSLTKDDKFKNHQFSQIHHVIGFVLDQCGATKEAISILHDMGISVTHSTILKKRKILVKQQEDRIKATAQAYTEQRKLILLGEAVIDSDSFKWMWSHLFRV
uniref:Uncharacterized protein n=1 Tax=Magallana gigas TaxID=29159 RepID=A0A8W8J6B5_MAGGI